MHALISGGDAIIAEASGHPDWGIGNGIFLDDRRVHDPFQWTGKNIQGDTLALVRQLTRVSAAASAYEGKASGRVLFCA